MHKLKPPRKLPMHRNRKWFGLGLLALVALGLAWHFSPGLPVLFGPSASAATKQAGYELFTHEWEANDPLAHGDGVGPVFNAKSCVSCHFRGGVGGGGDNSRNVRTFEVMPTAASPDVKSGVVHAFAIEAALQESDATVHRLYP